MPKCYHRRLLGVISSIYTGSKSANNCTQEKQRKGSEDTEEGDKMKINSELEDRTAKDRSVRELTLKERPD